VDAAHVRPQRAQHGSQVGGFPAASQGRCDAVAADGRAVAARQRPREQRVAAAGCSGAERLHCAKDGGQLPCRHGGPTGVDQLEGKQNIGFQLVLVLLLLLLLQLLLQLLLLWVLLLLL
jgi:hypothetical protein